MITTPLTPEAQALLKKLEDARGVLQAVAGALAEQNAYTVSHIQQAYLSFPKHEPATQLGLRVISNRLRSGVFAEPPVIAGDKVTSGIGNSVSYAAAHEFGATIPAHKVVPTDEKALRFMIGDRAIFAMSANIPEVTLPARSPVQKGIADRMQAYGKAVAEAVVEAISR